MRVISNKALREFTALHPDAETPLQTWRKLMEKNSFGSFAELKALFRSVDKVGRLYVFNIGGNKYRLVAAIHFNRGLVFIRAIMAHSEYDQDKWKD